MACRSLRSLRHLSAGVGGRKSRQLQQTRFASVVSSDNIVRSPVTDITFETGNFSDYVFRNAHHYTNNVAMTCCDSGEEVRYGQMVDSMARWGSFLVKKGLPKGAVVAVLSPNTVHYPTVLYGTARVGRVYTGINPAYTAEEIAHHLADSNTQLVVAYGPLSQLVKQAMAINGQSIPMVTLGPAVDGLPRAEDIIEDNTLPFADPVQVDGTETMSLLYSSGTTGKPKGASVSHNAAIANVIMISHPKFFVAASSTPSNPKRYLQLLPLFHVSGLIAVTGVGLGSGLHHFNVSKFDPATFLNNIKKHKITNLHMVPTLLNFIVSRPEFVKKNFPHIENILVGAAPVPTTAVTAVRENMGEDIVIQHAYGMTEVLLSHIDPVDEPLRIGYTGMPLPSTEVKILDVETGLPLPAYQDGEICMRNACVMNGYLNNEEATAATIDADGWVHSGDVGHYDNDGYIKVIDRTKDLIKVNALQVSPSEVEDALLQMPGVVETSVVGVPHSRLGETPRAYVITDGTTKITSEQVHQFLATKISKHKQCAGGVFFIEALPKNATGKVLRRELAKRDPVTC